LYRKQFGVAALIVFVGVCALLTWALRVSRDSRPAFLYAGWLGNGDDGRRMQAAAELGGLEAELTVPIPALVRALLSDRAVTVRKQAAVSLARLVGKLNDAPTTVTAAGAFIEALKDKAPEVRAAAADALGQIGPEPGVVVAALLRAAGDQNQWVHGAAVRALGLIQMKAGVDRMDVRPAIAAAMMDASFHVRELGIYAFWATAERSPGLSIALLRDGDARTRRSAVAALARSSPLPGQVVPELTAALSDEDAAIRAGAARALGNVWPPPGSAALPLMRALRDQDRVVRETAAEAISAINGGAGPATPLIPGSDQ
jgi:HEAT repeat protein